VACKKILGAVSPDAGADGACRWLTGFRLRPGRRAWAACACSTETSACLCGALAYILANGPDGLRQTTEDAVLNANYVRAKLESTFELPSRRRRCTRWSSQTGLQARNGVKTGDMGKRLIDYGFHALTR